MDETAQGGSGSGDLVAGEPLGHSSAPAQDSTNLSSGAPSRGSWPPPRLIRSPQDAEEAAAVWLRWFGFTDAMVTRSGADGGVDVRGRSMVAQVKAHMVPVSRPDLQKLYGVAQAENAVPIFFSLMSYTRDAQEWGNEVRMALFRFDHAGVPEAVNGYATALVQRAQAEAVPAGAAQPTALNPSVWGLTIGCDDSAAAALLAPRQALSLRRANERVEWMRQGWLPFAWIRYDITYLVTRGRHSEEMFGTSFVAFDLLTGAPLPVPRADRLQPLGHGEVGLVTMRGSATRIVAAVNERWQHFCGLRQTAALTRARSDLAAFAVPQEARSLRVSSAGIYFLPFFAALVNGRAGSKINALEGVTGSAHASLSALFTRSAPWLLGELYAGRPVAVPG